MKRLIIMILMSTIAFSFVITSTIEVQAQKVLEERITQECADALYEKPAFLENGGKFASQLGGIFNIQAQLPFTPSQCGLDKGGVDKSTGQTTQPSTTALPVKFLPFVLLKVYRFIISLAFYLFGLGLVVCGILIQTGVFSSNYDYNVKLRKYINNGIVGIATVIFAYYIVFILLWIFNASELLNQSILK